CRHISPVHLLWVYRSCDCDNRRSLTKRFWSVHHARLVLSVFSVVHRGCIWGPGVSRHHDGGRATLPCPSRASGLYGRGGVDPVSPCSGGCNRIPAGRLAHCCDERSVGKLVANRQSDGASVESMDERCRDAASTPLHVVVPHACVLRLSGMDSIYEDDARAYR